MCTRKSSNRISIIHRLVTDVYGENYWFNGCARYVMECLGEKDYDYWFFAGLTGDLFTQHYNRVRYSGDAVSSYRMDAQMGGDPVEYVREIFGKCGYDATYVPAGEIQRNRAMYLRTLLAYIDAGVPVILWGSRPAVFIGYEDGGESLLFITDNSGEPERLTMEEAMYGPKTKDGGWIFVGEKKEEKPLRMLYREAIRAIPQLFGVRKDDYCFGPEAFRAWAQDIESGRFDAMEEADFEPWPDYTNYVCVLATNGSCSHGFLKRARELNPDWAFLDEVDRLYRRMAQMWGGDRLENDPDSLETIGGGFNIRLETLRDPQRRAPVVAKIRAFADVADQILRVVQAGVRADAEPESGFERTEGGDET